MDWGDLFDWGGDTAFGNDTFSGSDWDWSSLVGGDDDSWMSDMFSVGGGGDSDSWFSGIFGGGGSTSSSSSGSLWGDLAKGILGGIGASADAKQSSKYSIEQIREGGLENRKTLGYAKELEDFYKKRDNRDKRLSLDSYGQFSKLREWKPDYVAPAVPTVPNKPSP